MKKIKSKAYSYFSNKASERMLIPIFNILNNDLMRNLLPDIKYNRNRKREIY